MIDIMLDSGAFSCWKSGKTLNLQEYVDFLLRFKQSIMVPVNLDVIPGTPGTAPTREQVLDSVERGWENFDFMRQQGLKPMHVFHQGEDFAVLEEMLEIGVEWVGISPRNDWPVSLKIPWLDEVFGYLCGNKGYPDVRVHGFGITALPVMLRYPWCTVDSMTWLLAASMGFCHLPVQRADGSWDYLHGMIMGFSRRDAKHAKKDRHWDQLSTTERAVLQRYFRELEDEVDMEITPERLVEDYMLRDIVNICFFRRAVQNISVPKSPKQFGFHRLVSEHGSTKPLHDPVEVFFTATASPEHTWALNRCGIRQRLISYFLFLGKDFDLALYQRTGDLNASIKRDISDADRTKSTCGRPVFGRRGSSR